MQYTPTAVRLDVKSNLLTVTWSDSHTSRYLGSYLRHVCPCAECRGHAPGEKEPPSLFAVRDVKVVHVEAVGTYAISFRFGDGHTTGIYTYDWMRSMCPTERDDCDDVGAPHASA
ncbi:MAG: DUF971 domain-containing protein [Planctomycetota bacterium]|nr:DUF971 domain-containing protein [Planctomycetota bacterium]